MAKEPAPIADGHVTEEQWFSLTDLQRKHFNRTWHRAKKAGVDYWEFIKLKRGERVRLNLPDTRKWKEEHIAIIKDGFERKLSTKDIAGRLGCSEDTIRSLANTNGIHRRTYRVMHTRVDFQYAGQTYNPSAYGNSNGERRFYVYAYLRTDGTPYYIGKGQGYRATQSHKRRAPKGGIADHTPRDPNRIRYLAWNLTEQESLEYEVDLIEILGRIELKTGCLLNFTEGGDGLSNPSQRTREKISQAAKERGMPEGIHDAKRKKANERTAERYRIPLEIYEQMSKSEQTKCLGWLRYNDAVYADYVECFKNGAEAVYKLRGLEANMAVMIENAKKYGVELEVWISLSLSKRSALRQYCNAHPEVSGADYLAGNYVKLMSSPEGKEHQTRAAKIAAEIKKKDAAKKINMPLDIYKLLTPKLLRSLRAWLRRNHTKTYKEYPPIQSIIENHLSDG